VVTAARLPPRDADAAFSVVTLDAEALEETPRVDEALKLAPGASLFRRTSSLAANATTQGVSLRAIAPSGAGRTLVLLDGMPIHDPFGGWVIWSQVPPEALESIEIVRGAGSGPWGAGALTGVVSLRERGEGGVLDLSAGSFGGLRLAGAGNVESGSGRLFGTVLGERSDGYTPVRGAARGPADRPLDLRALSAAVRLDLALEPADLSIRLGAWDEARGSGLLGARSATEGWSLSVALGRQPGPDRLGWRVQLWRLETDLFNTFVSVAADRSGTTPANRQFATPAVGWGANATLRGGEGAWQWELGADARFAEGETRERFRFMAGDFTRDRRAGGDTSMAGVYLDGSWRSGPWLVAAGVRADRWTTGDGLRLERDRATGAVTLEEHPADRSGEVVSGRLGLRYALSDDLALRAAAYTGFRPPTLNELHRPFRVGNDITESNPGLEPERLAGVEAGLDGTSLGWRWSATLFANRIDDPVANVTIGVGPGIFPRAGFVPAGGVLRERRNAGTIEAVGLEAEAARDFGPVSLRLALSLTDAEVDGGHAAPQLTGLRPAQAPEATVVASLDWRVTDRLSLSADVRWESERFEDDLNSRILGAATTLDVRADWLFSRRAGLYAAIDNLTDTEVEVGETADGTESFGPPRTLRVGLRLSY